MYIGARRLLTRCGDDGHAKAGAKTGGGSSFRENSVTKRFLIIQSKGPAGLAVQPLVLHLVNVGSIPTGPTHGEERLQPHPGDELTFTPNVRRSPRSGLNLEGRLSDPQILHILSIFNTIINSIRVKHMLWSICFIQNACSVSTQ